MEFVDIVNEKDEVIGKAPRDEAHEKGLWHRGTHVLVFDSKGRVLLQVRGENDYYGKYDLSVSEHVMSGEEYHSAAVRGLKEEIGIYAGTLTPLMKIRMEYVRNDNMFSVMYGYVLRDEALAIDFDEVKGVVFFSWNEVKELVEKNPSEFCPWTLEIFRKIVGKGGNVEILRVWEHPLSFRAPP